MKEKDVTQSETTWPWLVRHSLPVSFLMPHTLAGLNPSSRALKKCEVKITMMTLFVQVTAAAIVKTYLEEPANQAALVQ